VNAVLEQLRTNGQWSANYAHWIGTPVQARELLWTAPCDLTAAAGAVNGYQQAVLVIGRPRR
jgi:hypothetical protein